LALEVGQWLQHHALSLRFRLAARNLGLVWREKAGSPPWLLAERGDLQPTGTGVVFSAPRATVAGIALGELNAGWNVNESQLDLSLGARESSRAPLQVVVRHAAPRPTVSMTVHPLPLKRLAQPLGVELPVQGVHVSGTANLTYPSRGQIGQITGNVDIKLTGWVPPHPPELDAFVFGGETTFDTEVGITPDYRSVTLRNSRLKAGAFALAGGGSIARHPDHARLLLDLGGNLPCGALAEAVAQSHLGRAIGGVLGTGARMALKGSVSVQVKIDADTRTLAKAKIVPIVGMGCGLRPLGIPGVGQMDLGRVPIPKLKDLPVPKLKDLPVANRKEATE
ncbi:hypothetical protein ACFL5O_06260, partial [Myxococcota bacterium]